MWHCVPRCQFFRISRSGMPHRTVCGWRWLKGSLEPRKLDGRMSTGYAEQFGRMAVTGGSLDMPLAAVC